MFEKTQQKLSRELKNTPIDTSLVCSSVSSGLNREETLSVQGKVLTDNSLEENQQSGKTEQDLRVPVLNMHGEPLMPTTPRKARHLLKLGKAKVIKRTPFIIQLTTATGEAKQDIRLGIDSGYSIVGFSAITEKEELVSGELKLRKDVSKKILDKAMYRGLKRGKLWYRPPRFNNRTRPKGWLAPSLQHKLDTHIRLIENIRKWFPITKTVIEVATFDTQKMQNPEISGIEYQQGELQGYHMRNYLLEKFKRQCVSCKKKNIPLEIEHIIPKSKSGSSRVSNLTISCRKCNLEKGTQTAKEFGFPNIQKLAKTSLKATVFMNVIRKRLAEQVNAEETFGYITKYGRIINDLDKSHVNDAFIIASGTNQERCKPFSVTQSRRNNRCLQLNRKGFKPAIRIERYKLQPNDIVKYNNKLHKVKGVHCKGRCVLLRNKKSVSIKKIELISYGKGMRYQIKEKNEVISNANSD